MKTNTNKSLLKLHCAKSHIVTRITRHILELSFDIPARDEDSNELVGQKASIKVCYDRSNGAGQPADCILSIIMGDGYEVFNPTEEAQDTLGSAFNAALVDYLNKLLPSGIHLVSEDEWENFFDDLLEVISIQTGIEDAF